MMALKEGGYEKLVVSPLYPQNITTTTEAIDDQAADLIKKNRDLPSIHLIKDYHQNTDYIDVLAKQINDKLMKRGIKTLKAKSFYCHFMAFLKYTLQKMIHIKNKWKPLPNC